MSIASICFALEFILEQEMPELSATYPVPPDMLDIVPSSYILTGQGAATDAGNDLRVMTRTFRVQFPIVTKGAATPSLRESRCRPMLEKSYQVLNAFPTLVHKKMTPEQRPIGIQQSITRGDSGIVVLPEWGGRFVGFEIRVEVTELVNRKYKD